MSKDELCVVVVHHNNFPVISETVSKLLCEGVEAADLLVVDNSTERDEGKVLDSLRAAGIVVIATKNRGYGAAVNDGIDWWFSHSREPDFFLVATHEVVPEEGAVDALLREISSDPTCGVVGPLLVTGEDEQTIWSNGGYSHGFLRVPRHSEHLRPRGREHEISRARPVGWVDGAFTIIRSVALGGDRFDEDFFMYVEEVELQARIQRKGWTVKSVPDAVVWQSSSGAPPFYSTRNVRLLHKKLGRPILGQLAGLRGVLAEGRKAVVTRKVTPFAEAIRGYVSGGRSRRPRPVVPASFVLVNPLGAALAHYALSLRENLEAAGAIVETLTIEEPSISGRPRYSWLLSYWRALFKGRQLAMEKTEVISLWPTLGYWDLALARILAGPEAAVVVHDPVPLVRSIGYRPGERFLVRWLPLARTILHSATASDAYASKGFVNETHLLPHPIRTPRTPSAERAGKAGVRVLGQYKKDRDLDALVEIAKEWSAETDLHITGRGWPTVEGWDVDSRFVSEAEMDDLIESASVVVIPYTRFFQSGIAIRCAEAGTPFVGPRATSLGDLVGAESALLADSQTAGGWNDAVEHAFNAGQEEFWAAAQEYYQRCITTWADYALIQTRRA